MNCLHPIRVKTPLGERLFPCGKCDACLISASSFNTLTCQIEKTHNRYMYFVTLTYDNNNVPRFKCIDNWSDKYSYVTLQCVTPRLLTYKCKYKYICDELEVKRLRHILRKRSTTPNFLTFCAYEDIQKFFKRLRKRTDKYEKIRYYIAGDYGPRTFRAHWHCLLFFNSEKLSSHVREYIRESWPFGYQDASAATGGNSIAYTANYVNCNTILPNVFKTPQLKARTYHSMYFGTKDFDKNYYSLLTNPNDNMRFSYTLDGKFTETIPFRSCQLRLFPKPIGYYAKSYSAIKYSYNVYRYATELFGEWPISVLADLIVNADIFSNPLTAYFYNRYAGCHEENVKYSHEFERFRRRVLRYLYISKHFCEIQLKFNLDVDTLIFFIRNWYDLQSQQTLKRWYEEQEQDAKNGILHQTISRYYDDDFPLVSTEMGYKPVIFEETSIYREELQRARKRILEKIKHRKLNEANGYLVAFDIKQLEHNYKPLKTLVYG